MKLSTLMETECKPASMEHMAKLNFVWTFWNKFEENVKGRKPIGGK